MTILLEWIKPARIREIWPTIKPGLEDIEKRTSEWLIEDIYLTLITGQCNLHLCMVDNEYKGFTITQQQDNYGIRLHIWCGYSTGKDFNILVECLDEIKEWARKIDAVKVTFSTARKGWTKHAVKLGFKQSPLITYELGEL